MDIKSKIRTIPHWPKQGIMFRDITTLLQDKDAFAHVIDRFYERYKGKGITKVVGIESRGFIFGAVLAYKLKAGFVPARKPGKLPHKTIRQEYQLEYGQDAIEMHQDSIEQDDIILLVDDLVATGGTLAATASLIESMGARIHEICFVIDLPDLKGSKKLLEKYKLYNLIEFEGD